MRLCKKIGEGKYSYPSGYQIAFIEDEYQVFMGSFLFEILFYRTTSRTHWVAGVEDIDQDVRRVNDLRSVNGSTRMRRTRALLFDPALAG